MFVPADSQIDADGQLSLTFVIPLPVPGLLMTIPDAIRRSVENL
jgi:hypothetical protein